MGSDGQTPFPLSEATSQEGTGCRGVCLCYRSQGGRAFTSSRPAEGPAGAPTLRACDTWAWLRSLRSESEEDGRSGQATARKANSQRWRKGGVWQCGFKLQPVSFGRDPENEVSRERSVRIEQGAAGGDAGSRERGASLPGRALRRGDAHGFCSRREEPFGPACGSHARSPHDGRMASPPTKRTRAGSGREPGPAVLSSRPRLMSPNHAFLRHRRRAPFLCTHAGFAMWPVCASMFLVWLESTYFISNCKCRHL